MCVRVYMYVCVYTCVGVNVRVHVCMRVCVYMFFGGLCDACKTQVSEVLLPVSLCLVKKRKRERGEVEREREREREGGFHDGASASVSCGLLHSL